MIGRVLRSALANKRSYCKLRDNGTVVSSELLYPQYRFYSGYVSSGRGYGSLTPYNRLNRSCYSRNLSVMPAPNSGTAQALLAWKKLFPKYSYSGTRLLPRIGGIAQAVTLALTRSNIVIPGIFAFTCGQLAWAQKMDIDNFQSGDSLYTRAQNGHAYMTTLVGSAFEGLLLLFRALFLSVLFSPCIVMAPFADSFGPGFRRLWLDVLLFTLEKAGPAFIKWGQWAATRPDLFPRDLCTKLSELHMGAPKHSFAYTKKSIERAFGRKISDIFTLQKLL